MELIQCIEKHSRVPFVEQKTTISQTTLATTLRRDHIAFSLIPEPQEQGLIVIIGDLIWKQQAL